jgi:hypothetical protein
VNEEILLQAVVQHGRLVLPGGMSYRLLALPDHRVLSLEVLKKVYALVRDGATVCGFKPEGTVSLVGYPDSEATFTRLAEEVWGKAAGEAGEHRFGRGRAVWGKRARECLQDAGVPCDMQVAGETAEAVVDYIHRTTEEGDVYFVANQSPRPVSLRCSFRVRGRKPELWDPVRGTIRPARAFTQAGGLTTLPLQFDPCGSLFVIFREEIDRDASGSVERNFPRYSTAGELTGPWRVRWDPRRGGPDEEVSFETLVDWTRHPDSSVRHYSGLATYRKTFERPRGLGEEKTRIALDLGAVHDLAQVRLNGKDLGILWTSPFRVDVTPAVRPGKNVLEIDVVNQWPNRLIGDSALPAGKRLTSTNVTKYQNGGPLRPSGLLGPVRFLRVEDDYREENP